MIIADNVSGKHYGLLIPYHNGDVRNMVSDSGGVVVVVVVIVTLRMCMFLAEIFR